ncbi:MAG: AAA family ATPase [Myxococcales bacterium]|nr:AAA family ATPase [Myxococcales bacterium]
MTGPLDVLVIRGAPGVGKSTLGRGLRRVLEQGAVVEVDDVRAMIAQVDWTSRAHHDVALDVALAAIERFVAIGTKPVALVDTFSRGRRTSVQGRLDGAALRHETVSLWVAPAILAARLEARTTGFKDWEPSRILNDEVRANRYRHERLIDVTALDREAVLGVVIDLVRPSRPEGGA